MKKKPLSLRKCKVCLDDALKQHKKLQKKLAPSLFSEYSDLTGQLNQALEQDNQPDAERVALELMLFLQTHNRKSIWDHSKEFIVAILIALLVAGVVRQVWFELYEIPTGSMRPTFKESDRVLVVKDAFGINTPFQTSHLYFDPALVKRGNIVVITGDGLDLADVDTTYFGLFPGKRRYVKRLVGLPGDTLYFYGGKIIGLDKNNTPFEEPYPIEHIPFIGFEGKPEYKKGEVLLSHMNYPVAKIQRDALGRLQGKVQTPDGWQTERFSENGAFPQSFMQFWGIKNYATSRLISPESLPQQAVLFGYENPGALLYLELNHSPTLASRTALKQDVSLVHTATSWIALQKQHLDALVDNLYTARFFVRKNRAYRYTPDGPDMRHKGFMLSEQVPDGCYEFYNGTAYEIGYGAISHALDKQHPIYPRTPSALQTLYNFGIDIAVFNANEGPTSRYAYFRDGALYTLGGKLLEKTDPELSAFVEREKKRASLQPNYFAFIDEPITKEDASYIKAYGFHIPEGHYLLLGDNHAMSNDSRFFGPVPEQNLQGSPILTFWPPGPRWGAPVQPAIHFLRLPHLITLASVIVISGLCYWILIRRRHKTKKELFNANLNKHQ